MKLVELLSSSIPIIIQDDYATYPYLINSDSVELLGEDGDGVYLLNNTEVVIDEYGLMTMELENGDPIGFYLLVTKPLTYELMLLHTIGVDPKDT